ncbi:FAD-binding oxidoreductase [Gluconacetobacter liquefaciens]|uniref:FAD-binding oxidoreductase n=1 Tax=Gluconacetobacter liquefaciens TaxID=89584 RepID=A0A370FZD9_GLULI|nr:FAD-dependent oxidoreductase [Gluconacetobacter liquefaciens]MBB2187280.1 FAD-binding oxidoreductase [Gluconacetobacter liquefaciens]RDI36825.1 sarcosine oxidase subunit beta [Gluconacetobacter liquefaciens]
MMASQATTAVIGGGLHGLACALALAVRGQDVVVFERSWVGRRASGATAAGVRTLGRDPAEIALSLVALERWHRIADLVGDDCGFHGSGQIKVAENPAEMESLAERARLTRDMGFDHEELIDAAELRRLVPMISPHCVGGLVARRDGAADPHRTIAAFRRTAEGCGVTIREGIAVTALEPDAGGWRVVTDAGTWQVRHVVNAAGAWGGHVCRMIGEPIRFGYKASMVFVTERLTPMIRPVVSAAGRTLSFKQSSQGTLVIGGGLQGSADLKTGVTQVDFHALAKGAQSARALFPAIGTVQVVRAWAGLEGAPADLLPVIGPSVRAPGIFHMFGFSGHGFELVPVVGEIVADWITRGRSSHDIGAFDVARLSL